MAGYQDMADALLNLLRRQSPASNYVNSNNSNAKSDYAVLTKGQGLKVIIVPASFTRERIEFQGGKTTNWGMDVQIFAEQIGSDDKIHDAWQKASQAIIDTVDTWPQLDATTGVYLAEVTGGTEPSPLYSIDGGGPHFTMRSIRVEIQEDIEVTESE